jgi:hypothetical protein
VTPPARSLRALLDCLAPITLWILGFFVIYGVETLACMPSIAPPRGVIVVATGLTVLVIVVGAVAGVRRARSNGERDECRSFLFNTTAELANLALLATIWIGLASVMISPCVISP